MCPLRAVGAPPWEYWQQHPFHRHLLLRDSDLGLPPRLAKYQGAIELVQPLKSTTCSEPTSPRRIGPEFRDTVPTQGFDHATRPYRSDCAVGAVHQTAKTHVPVPGDCSDRCPQLCEAAPLVWHQSQPPRHLPHPSHQIRPGHLSPQYYHQPHYYSRPVASWAPVYHRS